MSQLAWRSSGIKARVMSGFEIRLTKSSFEGAWNNAHRNFEENTLTRKGAWGVPIPWAGKPDDAERAAYDLEITVEPTTRPPWTRGYRNLVKARWS